MRLSRTSSRAPRVPSDRGSDRLSARGVSSYSRRTEGLAAAPSDLGLGFERVVSEHFGRAGSGALMRTDSGVSAVGNGNPVAALRLTFMSMKSYGNTEKSSGSLGEDTNAFVGGVYRSQWSSSDRGLGGDQMSFRNAWGGGALCLVEEAAGELYRKGSIDDHWIIGERLGEGAFSEVRLGEGKNGEGFVAIKIVSKGAPDLFSEKGTCREVVTCSLVGEHPNVVQCKQVFEDDRFIYLVLELLTGGQMLPRVADSHYYPRYCENDVVTLVRCLSRALGHLHKLGIAHRDVKPENVLYASETLDPTVKLTDFGISHTGCKDSLANDMVGTPLYVAPEVLLRKPYGCAADMWSLGVIVHILLTGYPPFDDDDLVQLINKVKHKPLQLLGEEWIVISEDAKDFVRKLLTRDVEKRLTAEQALAHPWLSTPRPPPFPAPPMPSTALNSPARVKIPPTQQSRQDGTIPLMVAQVNLQSFVVRKEWRRMVKSEQSDRNLQLAMLVSLSEKGLGTTEDSVDDDKGCGTNREMPGPTRKEICQERCAEKQKARETVETTSRCRTPVRQKREKACSRRNSGDVEHQQEQERLRQQRLQLQAELSKKKKLAAKAKAEEEAERLMTVSTESLSTRSGSSNRDIGTSDGLLATSNLTDDSLILCEAFQSRREADAEADVETIQLQRLEHEQSQKPRGALIGRRGRQSSSSSTKQSAKPEKNKASKGKGRVRRKKQQSTTSSDRGSKTGNKDK